MTSQPVTRSRTLLFLSYRDSRAAASYPPRHRASIDGLYGSGRGRGKGKGKGKAKAPGEEGERLLSGDESEEVAIDVGPAVGLPPKWLDISDQVEAIVEGIKPKMVHLDRLTAKHVLPGFTDRSAEEREIEALTNDITRDFRNCQLQIRKIAEFAKYMQAVICQPQPRVSSSSKGQTLRKRETYTERDLIMAKNVQIALATKVQDLSTQFRKKQGNYLKQLKGYEIHTQDLLVASGAIPVKDPLLALEADEALSRSSLGASSSLNAQLQAQSQVQRAGIDSQDLITERDREITGIAQSISGLADLFKDLGHLAIDQGTLLDRIDYNVEQMNTSVQGAVEELKMATTYQRRSGNCRLIFLLILLICGAVIVLVYKPRHHSSASSSPSTGVAQSQANAAAADGGTNQRGAAPVVALDASEVGRGFGTSERSVLLEDIKNRRTRRRGKRRLEQGQ